MRISVLSLNVEAVLASDEYSRCRHQKLELIEEIAIAAGAASTLRKIYDFIF